MTAVDLSHCPRLHNGPCLILKTTTNWRHHADGVDAAVDGTPSCIYNVSLIEARARGYILVRDKDQVAQGVNQMLRDLDELLP